jgi:hypothetical protein
MKKENTVNTLESETIVVAKKRGRKSKKDIDEINKGINNELNNEFNNELNKEIIKENINIVIEETIQNINDLSNTQESEENENIIEETKHIPKKRGRKPKGGKIIQQIVPINNNKETKPNVILHLKCSLKDLNINSIIDSEILSYNSYNFQNKTNLTYDIINNDTFTKSDNISVTSNKFNVEEEIDYEEEKIGKENDIRDVWKKLKMLEHNLHINNICDKKSACFWCTYEFDNPPIYIPKHYIKESYQVYGCFCSPECATAHLMEENIDSSSKFERYHLINHIYSKIYDYTKNIKPAPNPYYMLEKYYGNLTIQEYRALLRNERLFLIVDKPLTRILPELHEDNDDFIINNKIIPSNNYQIKKKLQKKHQTKTNILSERFGLSQQ